MELSRSSKKKSWEIVMFGEIAQEQRLSTKDPTSEKITKYIGLEHIEPESLVLNRYGIIEEDKPSFTKKFNNGDILFGRRRAYLKKAAIAEFKGICSGDITVIVKKGEKLIDGLLPFIVQSDPFFEWAVKHSAGGLSPRTKFKDLAQYKILLPPKVIQEEILQVLTKIQGLLNEYEIALEKGFLFLEKLVKNNVFLENNNYDFIELSEYLEEVKINYKPGDNNDLNYVGFEHIDSNSLEIKRKGSSSKVKSNKFYFQSGDILYGKIGPKLKKIALANFSGICSSDIIVLRPKIKEHSYVLAHAIKTEYFANLASNTVSGSIMPRANWKLLSKIKINHESLIESKFQLSVKNVVEVIDGIKKNKFKIKEIQKKYQSFLIGK